MRHEPAIFPGIRAVSLFIEGECDHGAIFVFPLSGQNTPVLRDTRWRRERGLSEFFVRNEGAGAGYRHDKRQGN